MTQDMAVRYLRAMLTAAQKIRSINRENGIPDEIAAGLMPWLYGDRCVLRALTQILDGVDAGQPLAPGDFYNMMVIADRTPAIGIAAGLAADRLELPGPDMEWLRGWG